MLPDISDLVADDAERDAIYNRVRDMNPSEATLRRQRLEGYPRPTSAQRAEERLLRSREDEFRTAASIMARLDAGGAAGLGGFADQSRDPGSPAPGPSGHGSWATIEGGDPHVQQHRTSALRAIERHTRTGVMNSGAADMLDGVLRGGDVHGQFARYLAATGSDAYATAFSKLLKDPVTGHLRLNPAEVEAIRETSTAAQIKDAALTTQSTGFPLPVTIDPSILNVSSGALNPVRALADVRQISTHDHVGVTSTGVTASYVQEGVEATDATPSLAGPKINTQQGRAFVRFSIEAGQDDPSLAAELGGLISDARDVLDATMFLTGAGPASFQPWGIFGGDATYSLTTTQRVQTATTLVTAVGDPWAMKAQIPPRWLPRTTFAAAPGTWDAIYRFVAQGSTTEPRQFADGDRGGDFLGRPKVEWSTMATTLTVTGSKVLVGGDFSSGYRIVDRLGMNGEIIPHLFGVTAQLPVGQRGLYVYWRTGAAVVAQNAFRYLEVK